MTRAGSPSDVAVLGAGIMGCCLALELARRGRRVDLYDLADEPMTGASLHNEGKLHLGFVYAKDPLRLTHGQMLRGSLSFARIIGTLTGAGADALAPSRPFRYFVPVDSQLDMTSIAEHFQAVEAAALEMSRGTGERYLGLRIGRYHQRTASADHAGFFSPRLTLGSFTTEERSVSTGAVAALVRRAIRAQPGIRFVGGATVVSAACLPGGGVEVEIRRQGRTALIRHACAANCLWGDKLRVDATAGVPDSGRWILRYKAMISISAPPAVAAGIPSATGVLGAYGDVVNHGDRSLYLSWYPLCRLAQSTDGDGRRLNEQVHRRLLPRLLRKATSGAPAVARLVAAVAHRRFIGENIRAMADYIPALSGLLGGGKRCRISGGVILARGSTDIDDPQSQLHQRSAIGPSSFGSYVTVDTGKYCTAPLIALQTADLIEERL